MMSLSKNIKAKALSLGFAKVGIAPAESLPEEDRRLHEWLTKGYHATMRWMERNADRRGDIQKVVPGAQSVICVADNYYADVRHEEDPSTGKISRYAWGSDYHTHTQKRIESLLACIKEMAPEAEGRCYVDTGPVMEKLWAERAGIGWRGKHSNVITREFGSWVFLGEIITTLKLEYDTPAVDLCGTCTACLDACPTGAIVEPYVVDSSQCIAYLTIEHRGAMEPALAGELNGWLFGCDICQEVCPWNRFEKETEHPEFLPRKGNVNVPLGEISTMNQEEFGMKFDDSPVQRTKLEGLVRNAVYLAQGHDATLK
jgi:epoxyqueuosine reductase